MEHPPETPPKNQRTTARWKNACLEILRSEVHADYEWNRERRGIFIELYRTDPHGFHLSYSFVKVRNSYRMSFGVLLSSCPPVLLCVTAPRRAGEPLRRGTQPVSGPPRATAEIQALGERQGKGVLREVRRRGVVPK